MSKFARLQARQSKPCSVVALELLLEHLYICLEKPGMQAMLVNCAGHVMTEVGCFVHSQVWTPSGRISLQSFVMPDPHRRLEAA